MNVMIVIYRVMKTIKTGCQDMPQKILEINVSQKSNNRTMMNEFLF